MILYHGTNQENLKKILAEGILPRIKTGMHGNWTHTVPSKPSLVYLTDCYGIYFASSSSENSAAVLLKVDVRDCDLYPDEDFLAQLHHYHQQKDGVESDLFQLTNSIDPTRYKQFWKRSLHGLGTVATRWVRVDQIVAYAVISNIDVLVEGASPCISIQNHLYLANFYKEMTEWIFDGGEFPERFPKQAVSSLNEDSQQRQEAYQVFRAKLNDRSKIFITQLKKRE